MQDSGGRSFSLSSQSEYNNVSSSNSYTALIIILVYSGFYALLGGVLSSLVFALVTNRVHSYAKSYLQNAGYDTYDLDYSGLDRPIDIMMAVLLLIGTLYVVMGCCGLFGTHFSNDYSLKMAGACLIIASFGVTFPPIALVTHYAERQLGLLIMRTVVRSYDGDNSRHVEIRFYNAFMKMQQCCGYQNYVDFDIAWKWNNTMIIGTTVHRAQVPEACCKLNHPPPSGFPIDVNNCMLDPNKNNSNYAHGCGKTISQWMNSAKWGVVVFCFLLGTSQLTTLAAIAWFYEEITEAEESSQDRLDIAEFDIIDPFALPAEADDFEADEHEIGDEMHRRDSTDTVHHNQLWETILESVSIFFSNIFGNFWQRPNAKIKKRKRAPPVTFSMTSIPPTQKKSRRRLTTFDSPELVEMAEMPEATSSQKSVPKTDGAPEDDITLA